MSEPNDELTGFPEMDTADVSDALGVEPTADLGAGDAAQPTGDGAGPDEPVADPAADPDASLPDYRREAIANREKQELQNRIDRLERLIEQNNKPAAAALVPAGEVLTEEQKVVQGKFFKLFPQAKNLFEKAEQILRAADVAPGIAAQAEAADNHRATSALRSVTDTVAAKILGAGKTGAHLRPQARQRVATAFANWTGVEYLGQEDRMPAEVRERAVRYQNGDPTLFDEFAKDFLSDFTPANRPERVADARRASVKSPRGGPASAPPSAIQKPATFDDEDALHGAAFASVRASAAAG